MPVLPAALAATVLLTSEARLEQEAMAWRAWEIKAEGLRPVPSEHLVRRECRSIMKACAFHWPLEPDRYVRFMILTAINEDKMRNRGNPHDPSYGPWGVTVDAARFVGNVLGMVMPTRDDELRDQLKEDVEFNCLVAAGEAKLDLLKSKGNWERARVRYVIGLNAALWSRQADQVRKGWREQRAIYERLMIQLDQASRKGEP